MGTTDLKLLLRGNLDKFQTEADTYASGDLVRLGKQCIEYAIDLAGNDALQAVTVTVTDVNRGPLHIAFTLSSFDRTLLALAQSNVEQRVTDGATWGAEGSSQVFKFNDLEVVTAAGYEDENSLSSDGQWWESSMLQVGAVAVLLVICFVGGFGAWYCKRRKQYQYDLESMEQTRQIGLSVMRKDTADTPIGDGAGTVGTHEVVASISVDVEVELEAD